MLTSTLLIHEIPIECINQAAITYIVPATVIISVLLTENGKNGSANPNKNGTYDLGVMQINSTWLPQLAEYGYTREQIQYDACINVMVGTWILSQKMTLPSTESESYWQHIANYHSVTPKFNDDYQRAVKQQYQKLSQLLSINP